MRSLLKLWILIVGLLLSFNVQAQMTASQWQTTWMGIQNDGTIGTTPHVQTRPSSRRTLSSWWHSLFNRHDDNCTHETYRQQYNTPRRVPDRIPISSIPGAETSPTFFGPPQPPMTPQDKLLAQAAEAEAAKCRETASHVRRRTGKTQICGIATSKGKCYAAVKDALKAAGITPQRLEGGSAIHAHTKGFLKRAGYVDKKAQYNVKSMPVGCMVVYSGGSHGHGHIEIKTRPNLYCSDYCSASPIQSANYKVEAIYCRP